MRVLEWKPILIVSGLISAVHFAMLVLFPFPSVFLFPLVLIVLLAVVLTGIFVFSIYASMYGKNADGKLLLPKSDSVDGMVHFWMSSFVCLITIGVPYIGFVIWYTSTHSW
jgi:hypothetical protein